MRKRVKGFFLMTGIVSTICMIRFIFCSSKGNYSEVAKELQSKITEEMGEGYELIYPEEERIGIDHVIVDIDSGLYEDKNIFSDCSRLRDLIYHYVEDHPDAFSLIPAEDQDVDENISNAKGFSLQFTDSGGDKLYSGTDTVFTITNYLELEKGYDNGPSHMSVGTPGLEYGENLNTLRINMEYGIREPV